MLSARSNIGLWRKSAWRVISEATKLCEEVRACRLCEAHLPLGPRPVFQLHPSATILIAGQAPGRKVHETGLPFNDASGDRLRNWLGVTGETFYDETKLAILPMGFCFPGTGKSGDLPPRPECAASWRKPMLALLPNIELTVVLGQYAIDWHLEDAHANSLTETVRNWRQHWPNSLVLPHPSGRNNGWLKKNRWFEQDVVPALRIRVAALLAKPAARSGHR